MFLGNRQYGKWVDLKGLFDTEEPDLPYEKTAEGWRRYAATMG